MLETLLALYNPNMNPACLIPIKIVGVSDTPELSFFLLTFSLPFSLVVSWLHVPAASVSGCHFLPSCIFFISCGLSLCRRPFIAKPPHLNPAVIPAHTESFNNICHSCGVQCPSNTTNVPSTITCISFFCSILEHCLNPTVPWDGQPNSSDKMSQENANPENQ